MYTWALVDAPRQAYTSFPSNPTSIQAAIKFEPTNQTCSRLFPIPEFPAPDSRFPENPGIGNLGPSRDSRIREFVGNLGPIQESGIREPRSRVPVAADFKTLQC